VQDQSLSPVAGATGQVSVHLTTGRELVYPVTTDENGIGVVPAISFTGQLPGSPVSVDVSMTYQGLTANTSTSFLIWR